MPKLEEDQYRDVQASIELISSIVMGLPLADFIETAERSLEVAPYVNPTLYREAGRKMELIVDSARALQKLQLLVEKARKEGVIK